MDTSKFKGVTVALITPFNDSKLVDEEALRQLVDWHIEQGTNVILACGTTGEGATLSADELLNVMKIVIDQSNNRIPVLCGTGNNSTDRAVSTTKQAEELGADAILSVGPYYNKPTQEGFYQHFKAVAEATSLPIIIYNVPGRTGSNISAETTLRLAEIDNIIGTKEASGNMSQIMEILRCRKQDFLVLSGDDSITLPLIACGADGVISVVANEVPAMFADLVQSALNNDWDNARKLQYKLLPLMEANFIETNPIPAKTALAMMGKIKENFRLPLVNIAENNKNKLKAILSELELI